MNSNQTATPTKTSDKVFNTFSNLKNANTSDMRVGDRVIVNGYYSSNDGGESIWIIQSGSINSSNGRNIIKLQSNSSIDSDKELQARLVIENNRINVLQFGVSRGLNSDTSKNTTNIINALKVAKDTNSVLYFPKGYYMVGRIDLANEIGTYLTLTLEGEKPITSYTYASSNNTTHSILVFNGKKGKKNAMINQTGGILIIKNLALYGQKPNNNPVIGGNGNYLITGGKGGGDNDSRPRLFVENSEFSGWTSAIGGAHVSGDKVIYDKVKGQDAYTHIAPLLYNSYFYKNGVAISQAGDARIINDHFSNNYVDIAIGNGSGGSTINNSVFSNTKLNSIYMKSSLDAYDIENSKMITKFATSTKGPHDVTIQSNTFENQKNTPIYISTTAYSDKLKGRVNNSGILVIGNTFNGSINYNLPSSNSKELNSQKTRIYVSNCTGCIISNNKEDVSTDVSAYLKHSNKLIYTNNFTSSNYYYLKCMKNNKLTSTMSNFIKNGKTRAWEYNADCSNYSE